jgi:FSR family fosmidomycin resistance protein-like MFS transporter
MRGETVLHNRALLTLMLGHFTNDLFGGVLTLLLPVMKTRFNLDNAAIGLVALAYASTASLSQPFFGHLSDRHSRTWFVPATVLWGGTLAATWGFAPSYGVLLLLAGLAGLGSGAFHPLGASQASAVTDDHGRNAAMSIYAVGGTSGYALGPLVAVLLLALFGVRGTVALLVPAVVVAGLLSRQMTRAAAERTPRSTSDSRRTAGSEPMPWSVLGRIIAVVMLRSWVFLAVLQFVPIWYDDMGYSAAFYGPLATTLLLAGAVGTLAGGVLADRVGQRRVMLGSVLLAIPPLLVFAGFPGWWAFAVGAVLGLIADSSLGVSLVAAQRLLPGRTGIASGVILGLGFVTGGIGVPVTGRVADAVGLPIALMSLSALLAVAALLVVSIPASAFAPRVSDATEPGHGLAPSAGVASPSVGG